MTRDLSKPVASLMSLRLHPRLIRLGGRLHLALLRRFRHAAFLGAETLVLTTRGHETGQPRATPLYYVRGGDRLYIAASFTGRDEPPNWYLNLVAHPDVEVDAGDTCDTYRARVLEYPEAAAAWPELLATYPPNARYQRRTTRIIPVIELRPSKSV
jgi:deazaflavin-dependent oxidoreductase (nitroreductase family)